MFDFQNSIDSGNTIYCVKDTEGHVLYQNKACVDLCSDMAADNSLCDRHCMKRYTREKECVEREEGTQYFACQKIESDLYDIFFMNNGETLTSILYPLKNRIEADMKYYAQFGLTPKEMEIVSLVIQRLINRDICEKLNVSIGTLKTHLNNLYKKLPVDASEKLRKSYRTGC